MRESIMSPSNRPGSVGRFAPEQIAHRATWRGVPDTRSGTATMSEIRFVPIGFTTIVQLNPLDPGTTEDVHAQTDAIMGVPWLDRPADYGRLHRWPTR